MHESLDILHKSLQSYDKSSGHEEVSEDTTGHASTPQRLVKRTGDVHPLATHSGDSPAENAHMHVHDPSFETNSKAC